MTLYRTYYFKILRIELENAFVNFFSPSDAGMFARVFVLLRYDCCSCPIYKVKL